MRDPLQKPVIIALLVVATLAAFWPTFSNDFVRYDDHLYITDNTNVQNGLTLDGIRWAFSTVYLSNWHPLTWLSHMLDCQLFGVGRPGLHHAGNLLIHIANAILLFLLLNRMTRATICSGLVAMLFAIHPLHVESVAWASERKDVLSTLFGLLAIWAYVSYTAGPSLARYALIVLMMLLSLMAKPMLVTLPFLLLLLDYWPLRRLGNDGTQNANSLNDEEPWAVTNQSRIQHRLVMSRAIEKLPLLGVSFVMSIVAFRIQKGAGTISPWDVVPLSHRVSNAIISYLRYLGKTFWPQDLALLYPYPKHWDSWIVFGSLGLLVVITGAALVMSRRRPYLIVGWLWFLGLLVPVIGLIKVGQQSMADRYTYLPLVGVFVMLVWGVASLLNKQVLRQAAVIGAALVVSVLCVLTFRQTQVWRDSMSLFIHATESYEGNWNMYFAMGELLDSQDKRSEALERYQQAANLNAIDPNVQFKLAEALLLKGDLDRSIAAYENVVAAQPDRIDALNNLSFLLASHPEPTGRDGNRALALALKVCELTKRENGGYLDTLAVAYANLGEYDEAMRVSRKALELTEKAGETDNANVIKLHMLYFEESRPIRQPRTMDQPPPASAPEAQPEDETG